MSLTTEELARVAQLAELGLDDAQLASLGEDLNRVLTLVEEMQGIDVADVTPLAHPANATLQLRDDIVTEPDDRDNLQSPAPATEDGYFLVPRVIE
ncbi:MAG: Asp-tRNA(Asn)/Glu-tRNA(Gln) amidotransferase GatCAB subunit C [Gammaproteobacteria bacterium]|nr:MAG: Asp-tRNA(Asn)/Glu-tRNA(Gln) amidotransferase GatCAB subunit C [Gammaproteobacteria bacterium]